MLCRQRENFRPFFNFFLNTQFNHFGINLYKFDVDSNYSKQERGLSRKSNFQRWYPPKTERPKWIRGSAECGSQSLNGLIILIFFSFKIHQVESFLLMPMNFICEYLANNFAAAFIRHSETHAHTNTYTVRPTWGRASAKKKCLAQKHRINARTYSLISSFIFCNVWSYSYSIDSNGIASGGESAGAWMAFCCCCSSHLRALPFFVPLLLVCLFEKWRWSCFCDCVYLYINVFLVCIILRFALHIFSEELNLHRFVSMIYMYIYLLVSPFFCTHIPTRFHVFASLLVYCFMLLLLLILLFFLYSSLFSAISQPPSLANDKNILRE